MKQALSIVVLILLCSTLVFFIIPTNDDDYYKLEEIDVTVSGEHTHEFCIQNTDNVYLKTPARCGKSAEYYFSCECGEAGRETFNVGEIGDHVFSEPKYLWENGNNDCTASATCQYCNYIVIEKGQVSSSVTVDPVLNEKGTVRYTAVFNNLIFLNQEITENFDLYSISYNLDGGINDPLNPTVYSAMSQDIVILPPTKRGYNFIGWSVSGIKDKVKEFTVKCDNKVNVTLTANWEQMVNFVYANVNDVFTYAISGLKCEIEKVQILSAYNGKTIRAINDNAFNGSSVREVEIDGGIEFIGNGAFMNCTLLTKITLPSTLSFMGSDVFYGCKDLKDVYYEGTKEQWEKIDKSASWDENFGGYTVYCKDGNIER